MAMARKGLCRNWKSGCGRPTCKFRHPRGEGFFLPKSKYCYFEANEGRVCRRRATCPFIHAKSGDDSNQFKIGELQKEVNAAYEQLAAAQKCMGTLQAVVEGRERERKQKELARERGEKERQEREARERERAREREHVRAREREREMESARERERKQKERVRVREEEEERERARERVRRRQARESAFLLARSKREKERAQRKERGETKARDGRSHDLACVSARSSPVARRTRAHMIERNETLVPESACQSPAAASVRVEISGKYAHIVNGVYIRTDVSLYRHCGMDPEIVYTRDGSVWPRGPRTEHWPGIYLSPHGRDVWVISDLRRTACVYALSGDKLSGDLRPERVQKWMVFEKDGGVDGTVVRGGYVVSREWVEG